MYVWLVERGAEFEGCHSLLGPELVWREGGECLGLCEAILRLKLELRHRVGHLLVVTTRARIINQTVVRIEFRMKIQYTVTEMSDSNFATI